MGRKFIAVAFTAAGLMAGCAESVAPIAQTPSGRPEANFVNKSPNHVSQALASRCLGRGLLVQEASTNRVKCGGQMAGGDAVMTQLLIGNSYSTTPEQYVQFTLVPTSNGTRVQTQQWVETTMAFGQVQKLEVNSGQAFNSVQKALYDLGGRPI